MEFLKNPLVLIGAGGVVLVLFLMKNQGSSQNPTTAGNLSSPNTTGAQTPDVSSLSSNGQTAVNALGGTYSYLDGTGVQHIIATDPYGNLVGYSSLPPGTSNPQPGQLSSSIGMMGGGYYLFPPYGGYTNPIYSTGSATTGQ